MRSAFAQGKKGAVFDINGALAGSVGVIVAGLGDAYGRSIGPRPSESEIQGLVGMPMSEQMTLYGLGERDPKGLDARIRYAHERCDASHGPARLFGPAIEAMRRLRAAGLRIALVPPKNAHEIEIFLRYFPELLEADAAVCASDVARPKPHPECALTACERLGVQPDEACTVGASVYDRRCARAARCACVAALAAEAPNVLLRTPEELLDWVGHAYEETLCHAARTP